MQEVTEARRLLWAWLEGRGTGLMEADPGTWLDEVIITIIIIIIMIIIIIIDQAWPDWPGRKKYGSLKMEAAAQQPAAWHLRALPSLRRVFSQVSGKISHSSRKYLLCGGAGVGVRGGGAAGLHGRADRVAALEAAPGQAARRLQPPH